MAAPASRPANRRLAMIIAGTAVGMLGMAYAAVPLYTLFCQVTGFGGTTQRATEAPARIGERMMTVRFDANVAGSDLPWSFAPAQREVKVHVGEEKLIYYRATNRSAIATTGTATFNVTPNKAGIYFDKVACFCFTEQRLEAGESLDMPVSFFIDPKIVDDPNLRDVNTITLSYTFFRAKDDLKKPDLAAAPQRSQTVN
ncbi:MAG: cytochrome c oxidase assembly protein [Rhodospirillales bacterium]|nr:cytochrome c oxidase assembly protein [Rhodospirillales bacterium]